MIGIGIGEPCERCNSAYGHKRACPENIRDNMTKTQALVDWQRGIDDAENGIVAKSEDKANGAYMLGREIHKLTVQGLRLKHHQRLTREPSMGCG